MKAWNQRGNDYFLENSSQRVRFRVKVYQLVKSKSASWMALFSKMGDTNDMGAFSKWGSLEAMISSLEGAWFFISFLT